MTGQRSDPAFVENLVESVRQAQVATGGVAAYCAKLRKTDPEFDRLYAKASADRGRTQLEFLRTQEWYKELDSKRASEHCSVLWATPEWAKRKSEEFRQARMKDWQDPAYAEKMLLAQVPNTYVTGFHQSPKIGQIYYQSSYELKAYEILDADDTVAKYERGPIIPYFFEEEGHKYVSDILVTYANGSKRIIEVKADKFKHDPQNRAKYLAGCLYSKKMKYLPYKVWDSKWLPGVSVK